MKANRKNKPEEPDLPPPSRASSALVGMRNWQVPAYVIEEVRRQNHSIASLDGIERVGWMIDAWSYAIVHALIAPGPDIADMIAIARRIEPVKNKHGYRDENVYTRTSTGVKHFAVYTHVPRRVSELFARRDMIDPLEFYKEFEEIHPFLDGNGRTGKVLLNWLHGTLLEPVFPPNDLFGEPITNP